MDNTGTGGAGPDI